MSASDFTLRRFLFVGISCLVAVGPLGCAAGTVEESSPEQPGEGAHGIFGTVSGAVADGVSITLSGASSAMVTTAADGTYQFAGLADGAYTITPSFTGYSFSPSDESVAISAADAADVNFTATVAVTPPSANDATATPPSGSLVDGSGDVWSFDSITNSHGNEITLNGAGQPGTGATLLLYHNGSIYQENALSLWWVWQGGRWIAVSGDPRTVATPPPAPTVSLSASPLIVISGGTSTLTWSSTNATSCVASGGWTGTKAASGTSAQSPTSTATYTLTCTGADGSTQASTTVTVTTQSPTFSIAVGTGANSNKLINQDGVITQLRGINFSALEGILGWSPLLTSWPYGYPPIAGTASVGSGSGNVWTKMNCARVPLNQASWSGGTFTGNASITVSPAQAAAYQQTVISTVESFTSHGIYVILDLHWTAPGSYAPLAQNAMADATSSIPFWTSLANTFGYPNGTHANPAVILDLFNEPFIYTAAAAGARGDFPSASTTAVKYAILANGGAANALTANTGQIAFNWTSAGYQQMLDAVRATGATNVVMMGGESYSNDPGWWLSNPPNDPLEQIAVSIHMYPGAWPYNVTNDTSKGGNVGSTLIPAILASIGRPVIIGEMGDGNPAVFLPVLLPEADSYGWSYCAWGWYGGGSPVLTTNANGTPSAGFGVYYRNWLANHP